MGAKGEQTRQQIIECARELFAKNGFTKVTMKDVCETTGLSRGGLYRHFGSTEEIFVQLFQGLSHENFKYLNDRMMKKIPAPTLLEQEFQLLEEEMVDQSSSLSLAIYEYAVGKEKSFFEDLHLVGREKWKVLLHYGMERGEFRKTDVEPIIDLIVYSYQGVRLWSRIVDIDRQHIQNMLGTIKEMLLIENREE